MFLSGAYFQGELYLPNLKRSGGTVGVAAVIQAVGENTLEWYIDKYEAEFLRLLLGDGLAEALMSNYPDGGEIWVNLHNRIYHTDGKYPLSPAANYVYYWICRRGRTQMCTNGEVRGLSDYTEIAQDTNKLVKTWNDMVAQVPAIRRFVLDNYDSYRDFADKKELCCHRFEYMNIWNL